MTQDSIHWHLVSAEPAKQSGSAANQVLAVRYEHLEVLPSAVERCQPSEQQVFLRDTAHSL
jgi:hypothetical protein